VGRSFGSSLTKAFSDAAVRGRKLSDVVRSLALSLSRSTLRAAVKPVSEALSGAVTNALNFHRGGVFSSGMTVPFARGGVIGAPAAFPLRGGRTGFAGEAGPEAILPLARGGDGRLGVRAEGGAPVAITFNVTTPDAESFRRSESQVAAMLNRAVSRGERNL
jgi:phage-related minor tail protein